MAGNDNYHPGQTARQFSRSNFGSEPPNGGDAMERIAKLEARADAIERNLDKIDGKLDRVLEKLGGVPTTNGLWGMIATVIGVGLAISGLTFAIADYVSKVP